MNPAARRRLNLVLRNRKGAPPRNGAMRPFWFLLLASGLVAAGLSASASPIAGTAMAAVHSTSKVYPANPSTREVRSFQIQWQSALLDSRAGRWASAARTLEALKTDDTLTQIYRASFLAEAYLLSGRRKQAAQVLDEVLPKTRSSVWVRHLYRLRLQAYDPAQPATLRREFLTTSLRAPLDDGSRLQVLYRMLELDSVTLPVRERPALIRQLVPLAFANSRLDTLYRRESGRYALAPVGEPQTGLSGWDDQKLMLDLEEKLTHWSLAVGRAERLLAADNPAKLGAESVRTLQLKIAQWHFNKGTYAEAIKQYTQWRDRYGETAEVLQQLARSHRNLSQDARAQGYYSRLLELYPKDNRSAEILWMRTFDAEMLGRMEDAVEGYARIADDFPGHTRGPESMFRIGLTYFKRGDFDAAAKAFRDLQVAQKKGRLVGAARYWEGKALAKRGDGAGARAVWRDLAVTYPFGYYGHQALRELRERGAWPDSLTWSRRFRELPDGAVKAWMMTVMSGVKDIPDGAGESPYLPLSRLIHLGMDSLAVLTLQSQVSAAPGNPWVLYLAATRCREAGFDYEAYRFGVRLADRLPLETWPNAPLSVLRLFYPPSYESIVRMEATRAAVPSSLVLALIKQESGFEPRAVSRVGARGLMQMMPATGTQQARKEKVVPFDPDSLFVPRVNTRLGIAYLRDVLKRYNGNPYYALAHYNAGPTAVDRWMPRFAGRPPEEAVEDIGYAETRDYVKRVMGNYWTYRELWN